MLGFAPWIWLVIIGMAVRNALMNASNPIFGAFAMERVKPLERATVAATMKNAADEKSAGTYTWVARRRWPPSSNAWPGSNRTG